MTNEQKTTLCTALLDDDQGISENGYNTLLLLDLVPSKIEQQVQATDGRFYIEEGV